MSSSTEKKIIWSTNWYQYKTIQKMTKLATGQSEMYKTGYFSGYDKIKNPYRVIAAYLSRERVTCWSENNSANRICLASKKIR